MIKQNEQLITLINRLCAVEEWAREVVKANQATKLPLNAFLTSGQKKAHVGLVEALADLDKVRGPVQKTADDEQEE